jgi:hypothetical protein
MTACLAGLVFAYWLTVGYAITSRLLPSRQAIPKLLLAPAIGFATTELSVFVGMRTGEPIQAFGIPLIIGLFAGSIISLLIARPVLRLRRYAPFAGLIIVSFVLNGWPLIRYGQDWIGHSTHDMSAYCEAAEGFKMCGANRSDRDYAEFDAGRDNTFPVRNWYIRDHVRRGSEISLGTFSLVASRDTTGLCMAFAVAMHLVLVSATGFLAYRYRQSRKVALGATAFMAVSAASSFGILEQMLGQIGGLALLVAATGILCRPGYRLNWIAFIQRTILGGLLLGGLTLQYPEVLPFFVASVGGITVVGVVRRRIDWKRLAIIAVSALLGLTFLGTYGLDVLMFLVNQLGIGRNGQGPLNLHHEVFKTVHGLLLMWGLQTRLDHPEVVESISGVWGWTRLVFSVGVLCLCLAFTIILAWRQRAAWVAFGAMTAVGVLLYHSHSWYGIHKLCMYIQPFLATVVAALAVTSRWKIPRLAAITLFIGLVVTNAAAQYRYVSAHNVGNFPSATQTGLATELEAVRAVPAERFYVAVENWVLTRFLTVPTHGREAVTTMSTSPLHMWPARKLPDNCEKTGTDRIDSDPIYRGTPAWLVNPSDRDYLIVTGQNLLALNRSRYGHEKPTNLRIGPINEFHNHLIFRESRLSRFSFPESREDMDFFAPNASTAVIYPAGGSLPSMLLGSHITLQVLKPNPRFRLVVCASSLMPEWAEELPDIKVYGRTMVEFGFGGSQRGRTISPTIEPAHEGTLHTLRIDLKRKNSIEKTAGVNTLNRDDMATFCHDLSVLSEEAYQSYIPPAAIDFSQSVLDYPLLEYCGGYDNGWVGKAYRVRLTSTSSTSELVVQGLVPMICEDDQFNTIMKVLIDGVQIHQATMKPGYFTHRIPGVKAGPQWIEFRFSNTRQYPPDTRPFSANFKTIGFEPVKLGK